MRWRVARACCVHRSASSNSSPARALNGAGRDLCATAHFITCPCSAAIPGLPRSDTTAGCHHTTPLPAVLCLSSVPHQRLYAGVCRLVVGAAAMAAYLRAQSGAYALTRLPVADLRGDMAKHHCFQTLGRRRIS